jgi:hypothetical protein
MELLPIIQQMLEDLPLFLSQILSGDAIKLNPNEISVRVIPVTVGKMIAPIEIEIIAHAFDDRVEKQDAISSSVRMFLLEKYPACEDIRVWLQLSELGHSW